LFLTSNLNCNASLPTASCEIAEAAILKRENISRYHRFSEYSR